MPAALRVRSADDERLLYRASIRVQDREGQLKNAYLDNQYVDYKESAAFRGRAAVYGQ